MKVSKTKAEGKHLYINVLDFSDEREWELMYKKIKTMIETEPRKLKVFGGF